MEVQYTTPILNVSNIVDSILWFKALGFELKYAFGEPPNYASIASGPSTINLCLNGQGGQGENGAWLCVWVDDVDRYYEEALDSGLKVSGAPKNEPWNVREFTLQHPDGHRIRISRVIEST